MSKTAFSRRAGRRHEYRKAPMPPSAIRWREFKIVFLATIVILIALAAFVALK